MINYTNDELQTNYNKFIDAIRVSLSGDRLDKILKMYSMSELGPNLMVAPASSRPFFHNAYVGGYIDHVINVVRNSIKILKVFQESGGLVNFTQQELIFSAFHHDLGKLGTKEHFQYINNPSDWHVKNRQELYISNPKLSYMSHTDRTFFLLNQYGIEYSENEFFGIKLTDGMYDDDNKKYLVTWSEEKQQRSSIGYVLHVADSMSALIERTSNK